MELPPEIMAVIQSLAFSSPTEVCGLVTTAHKIIPITNVSRKKSMFIFDKAEYVKALLTLRDEEDSILCVYHSHLTTPTPSKADLECVHKLKCDFLIVSPVGHQWVPYAS